MSLPDFELGPLEMREVAASEPVVAPATARVAVGLDDFLLRLCAGATGPNRLFFRLDAPGSAIFEVPRHSLSPTEKIIAVLKQEDAPLSSLCEETSLTLWQRELPPLLAQTLVEGHWRRDLMLPISGETEAVRVCFSGQRGMWFYDPVHPINRSTFFGPSGKNLTLKDLEIASDTEVAGQVLSWLGDPASDCSFAYQWSQLAYDERSPSIVEFKQGTWDEFAQVLQWLSWSEEDIWKDQYSKEWVISFSRKSDPNPQSRGDKQQYELRVDTESWDEILLSARLEQGLDVLHFYFEPIVSSKLESSSMLRMRRESHVTTHRFIIEPPTFHEVLEARLQLREWLSDKVAPDEIAVLLGGR